MNPHNCDGKIGEFLYWSASPAADFNDGQPTWFMMVAHYASTEPLAVNYCPVCGERLPPLEDGPAEPRVRYINAVV